MATLAKSEKPKVSGKVETYTTTEQVSLAKNGDFLRRIKELNVKVVVKK